MELLEWCKDAVQFAEATKWSWEFSPLQLYQAALIYWRHPGPVFTHYASTYSEDRPVVRMLVERQRTTPPSVVFHGHSEEVQDVAFSPDGQHLASCANDGTVRIWNASSGVQEMRLELPSVQSLVYLSTVTELVAATKSGPIHRFNLEHGTSLIIPVDVDIDGCKLRVSPMHDFTISGTRDGQLLTINLLTNTVQGKLQAHKDAILDVDISADGTMFASSSTDGSIYLWDGDPLFSNPQPLRAFSCMNDECQQGHWVSLSSDSRTLATCSFLRLHLWNIDDGDMNADFFDVRGCRPLVFSDDGRHLAKAAGNSLQLHDGKTGEMVSWLKSVVPGIISGLAFSPDGTALAALDGTTIYVRKVKDILASGKEAPSLHEERSFWAFSGDYRRIVQVVDLGDGNNHQQLVIWDIMEGKMLVGPQNLTGRWREIVSLSQSGRILICAGKNRMELRDGSLGDLIGGEVSVMGRWERLSCVVISPCEKMVAILSGVWIGRGNQPAKQDVELWSIEDGLQLAPMCTISLVTPIFKRPTITFDSHSRHVQIDHMVWNISQHPPSQLSYGKSMNLVQNQLAQPQFRLRWNFWRLRLDFGSRSFNHYPANPNWGRHDCHVDGDVAIISSKGGNFVVLDFRYMPAHARGYGVYKDGEESSSGDEEVDWAPTRLRRMVRGKLGGVAK